MPICSLFGCEWIRLTALFYGAVENRTYWLRRWNMGQDIQDYLFDLQGYLVLENAIFETYGSGRNERVDRRAHGLKLKIIRSRKKPRTCHPTLDREYRNAYL